MDDYIRGAGGGGEEKQHTPVEAPDSLHSVAYAKIDDLVSEGPIQGLADGLKSIFFNETPLANADGTLNFKNVQVDWRLGDQSQTPIPGFGTVENEIAVSVQLKVTQPWTQALSNTTLDGVRVRISTPLVSRTNTENGDVSGSSVAYAIDVATDGGAFQTVLSSAITGKTTSKYERSHRIDLPAATTGWIVRVRRLTPDSTSATLLNDTFIESYTELVDAKLAYPNSAHVATVIDAAQFQQIPNRAFDLFGYNAVPVPTNYDPETRTYAGIWDGTFQPAWTDNPAWLFNLVVTHTRFGLGHLVNQTQVSKWALYRIAQWCDQLVPDGFGGTEPRLTCNLFLQTQEDAYKVLSDMASIFRGISYWAGGAIVASADQPTDPAYLYTPANVVEGKFEYAGSGKRARHTVALVSWNDPQDFYRPKVEYVEDLDGIARYGVNQTDVIAIGCTSRGQARRMGRAILTTERLETDLVTFRVGLEGTVCAPGQVIAIADPLRAGRRMGGRVSAATATTVTVDKLPSPLPSPGTVLNVIGRNGALMGRNISTIDEPSRTITVTTAFDTVPVAQTVWAFDDPNLTTAWFRVLSVTEEEGLIYTITALRHEPDKYNYIDALDPIEPRTPTATPVSDLVPAVVVGKYNRRTNYNTETIIAADWEAATNAQQYEVQWRKDDGNWTPPVRQQEKHSEFPSAYPGTYLCKVSPVGANGTLRAPTYSNLFTWADDEAPPDGITDIIDDVDGLGQEIADEVIRALAAEAANAQAIIDETNARLQLELETAILRAQVGDILEADEWVLANEYPEGDLVQSGGKLYRALQDVPANTPITNAAYWEELGNYASLGEAVSAIAAQVEVHTVEIEELDGEVTAVAQTVAQHAARMPAGSGLLGTEAQITTLETAMASGDAANAAQITQLSAKLDNGVFQSAIAWQFIVNHNGFAASGAGLSQFPATSNYGATVVNSTSTDPIFSSPSINVSGKDFPIVRALVRRRAGAWEGALYWATNGHGFSGSHRVTAPIVPVISAVEAGWTVIEWDLSAITDWRTSTITQLRFDFGSSADSIVDVRWISVGQEQGPAGSAQAQTMIEARVSQAEGTISTQATQITNLEVEVDGKASAAAVTALDTRVDVVEGVASANSAAITQVQAEVDSIFSPLYGWQFVNANTAAVAYHGFTVSGAGLASFVAPSQFGATAVSSTGVDPHFISPVISIDGKTATVVRALIRRRVGTWQGFLYWATSGHGFIGTYGVFGDKTPAVGAWEVIEWDLSTNSDWNTSTVTRFQFDFGMDATSVVDVRWIAIGTKGPEASAKVLTSMTASAGPSGAYAQATVMTDVNGYIAGTRLTNNGTESDFTILADKFSVIDPSGGARLEWSDGNVRVYDTNAVLRVRMGVW